MQTTCAGRPLCALQRAIPNLPRVSCCAAASAAAAAPLHRRPLVTVLPHIHVHAAPCHARAAPEKRRALYSAVCTRRYRQPRASLEHLRHWPVRWEQSQVAVVSARRAAGGLQGRGLLSTRLRPAQHPGRSTRAASVPSKAHRLPLRARARLRKGKYLRSEAYGYSVPARPSRTTPTGWDVRTPTTRDRKRLAAVVLPAPARPLTVDASSRNNKAAKRSAPPRPAPLPVARSPGASGRGELGHAGRGARRVGVTHDGT